MKFKTKKEFRLKSKAYAIAIKNNWIGDACEHMELSRNTKGFWTKKHVIEESLKYRNRTEFRKQSPSAYSAALKNDWLDDLGEHMISKIKSKNYWTKDRIIKLASGHQYKSDFKKEYGSAYSIARKNKWLDEVCSHMIRKKNPPKWTKSKIKTEALKFKSRTEFARKSKSAYSIAQRNGWLNDVCVHM